MKPDFESALVYSTFKDESLPEALKKAAVFLEENPTVKDYDGGMIIQCVYEGEDTDKWYVSFGNDYWNEPKVVNMIKKKKIRGK
jgi:hypothetical protein